MVHYHSAISNCTEEKIVGYVIGKTHLNFYVIRQLGKRFSVPFELFAMNFAHVKAKILIKK